MKRSTNLNKILLLGCCSVSVLMGNAYAEDGEDKKARSKVLEEVVVTAQKREQSLQDVPTSMKVMSGDEFEANKITDGFDLIKYLPGFGLDDNREIRTTTLKTRGIGTFTNSIGLQSSNLVVIDGEVLPRQSMLNLAVSDVERVEALRGPQGTLFGQNTSTGLIHYVTKRPTIGKFNGKVRAEVSEYSGRDLSATVNLPIDDQWAVRLNAQWGEEDGWIDNTMPGEEDYDIGQDEKWGLRGQVLFDNGSNFDALLRAEYSERDTNCCSQTVIGPINVNFGPSPIIHVQDDGTIVGSTYNTINPESTFDTHGGPVTARNRSGNYGSTENTGLSLELNYDLGGNKQVTYIGSYRDYELLNSSTFFNLNFPIEREAFGGNESVEIIQQEVRLSSFGNDKLDWVVGLFYHDTKGQRSEVRDGCIAGNRGFIENGMMVGCYSGASTNNFLNLYRGTNIADADTSILVPQRLLNGGDFTTNFENIAIFGQLEYQITDRLDATLGFRALKEKGSATFDRTDLRTPADGVGMDTFADVLALAENDPSLFINRTEPTKFSDSDTDAIYKAVLGYDFTDAVRGYVSYSTGYKGSSYFVTSNTNPDEVENFPTLPEQSSNFEIGLRTRLLDDQLLFNVTWFDMVVEDYQTRAFRVLDEANGISFAGYVNADEARSTGFEMDFDLKVTENLSVQGSYANFNATYEDFANAPISCPGGALQSRCSVDPVLGNVFDQSGLSFENNAEEQFLGTIMYDTDIGASGWDGNIRAVWRYNGEHTQSINELAQGLEANPSHGIWDLYFGLGNDQLRFNLFVKNVFDKPYTTSQRTDSLGNGFAFFPRDWTRYVGGSVQYSFK
ncbi:MAG: TonB-dependent receptor [Gammaproteobacteria bacterium]|uniref:TonB-dependent receptor n=1 Tax=Pseudomaricurvus alcaniphilus TaxID=1166482 RepID=UPI00140D1C56|nr:TonB-dependent receptor [Pseudomaricurvus alcaniphilus]MBR9912753.1 TonB-dependent receptor [Gammaproteobacteria bacterium]NHN39785.1 TonB-dependent receptor [Pseudomaricurvus alcaniphilus]